MSGSSPQAPSFAGDRERASAARILLVSPVHNEAEHIDQVARAVVAQSRPPDLWLAADDDSNDGTLTKLRELEREIPFMRVLSAPLGHTPDSGDRLAAAAVERAFAWAIGRVEWRSFTHIGKLDGDTVLPPNYLEEMLGRFEADPSLGVAGGVLTERSDRGWAAIPTPPDHATGPARIYSQECFETIGGVPERLGSDPMMVTYARMGGFTTRTFADLPLRHLRPHGSKQGALRGRARHGATQYIVHYGFLWAVLRSLKLALYSRPRVLGGAAFLFGYLRAALGSTGRVDDKAFRAFAKREQRRRLIAAIPGGPST